MRGWFRYPVNAMTWLLPTAAVLLVVGALTAANVVIEIERGGQVTVTDPDNRVELRQTPPDGGTGEASGGTHESQDAKTPVAFSADTPTLWDGASPLRIEVTTPNDWPSDADVLVLAWSDAQSDMVDGLAPRFERAPVALSEADLNSLPSGSVELQALWRKDNRVVSMARHRLHVERAAATDQTKKPHPGGNQNDDGFTAWPLHPDARAVYVSADGDDLNSGLSPRDPVRSLIKGKSLLRDSYGDHLLLRAGDTFRGGFGTWAVSGYNRDFPVLIGVYGDGDRPTILTTGGGLLRTDHRRRVDFVALQGVHAVAERRDPSRAAFDRSHIPYRETGVAWFASAVGLHVEDCVFERFNFHLVLQHKAAGGIRDVTIRRCVLADAYSHWDGDKGGHSSGMFATGVTGLRIDECVFDHNGWAAANEDINGAGRTKFNHNIYIQQRSRDVAVTRSVLARGASYGLQLRPGGRAEGNLFARNTHGMYLAVAPSVVAHNVVAESTDLHGRAGGKRGNGIMTWPVEHALIEHNLVLDKRGSAPWAGAFEISAFGDWSMPVPGYRVTLRHNTVSDWPRNEGRPAIVVYDKSADVTMQGNVLDRESGGETEPRFVDPDMDLDQAAGGSFVDWLERARQRPRGTWDETLAAKHLNGQLFAAYALKP